MWVSRPGLGLETDQDHFFEVLVLVSTLLVLVSLVLVSACLVLVSEGGQDLRLCATATLLVSKVETSKWMCSIIYLFVVWQTDFDVFVHYYIYCSAIFKRRWMKTVCVYWLWPRQQRSRSRVLVLVSTMLVLVSDSLVLITSLQICSYNVLLFVAGQSVRLANEFKFLELTKTGKCIGSLLSLSLLQYI